MNDNIKNDEEKHDECSNFISSIINRNKSKKMKKNNEHDTKYGYMDDALPGNKTEKQNLSKKPSFSTFQTMDQFLQLKDPHLQHGGFIATKRLNNTLNKKGAGVITRSRYRENQERNETSSAKKPIPPTALGHDRVIDGVVGKSKHRRVQQGIYSREERKDKQEEPRMMGSKVNNDSGRNDHHKTKANDASFKMNDITLADTDLQLIKQKRQRQKKSEDEMKGIFKIKKGAIICIDDALHIQSSLNLKKSQENKQKYMEVLTFLRDLSVEKSHHFSCSFMFSQQTPISATSHGNSFIGDCFRSLRSNLDVFVVFSLHNRELKNLLVSLSSGVSYKELKMIYLRATNEGIADDPKESRIRRPYLAFCINTTNTDKSLRFR